MRRLYLTLSVAGLMAIGATMVASADYARIPQRGNEGDTQTVVTRKLTPKMEEARKRAASNPFCQLQPVQETGLMQTPKIQNKPRKMLAAKPEKLRGNLYSHVSRHSNMTYYNQAFLGKIDQNSGKMSVVYTGAQYSPYLSDDYVYGCATLRDGIMYIPGTLISFTEFGVVWNRIELATGEQLEPLQFGSDIFADPYTLVFDEVSGKFFGLCYDQGQHSQLVSYDPDNNFKVDYIGWIGDRGFIGALAYNPEDREVYAFGEDNMVYTLNRSRGTLLTVAELTSDYDFFPNQDVMRFVYSPLDHSFVTVYNDNDIQAPRLLYIDPEEWEVEEGAIVTANVSPYITSLVCPDLYAPQDAPEYPAEPEIIFEKNNLTGSFTFSAPEFTFAGVSLGNKKIEAIVKVDGNIVVNENMTPGDKKTVSLSLAQGLHVMEISFANGKDNVSPVRKTNFYVGNDKPCAPANIKMTDTGHLTWTAPGEVGVNNGYVDTSVLSYNIFVDDEQQNGRPVSATEYDLYMPKNLKYSEISVTATANQQTSPKGSIQSVIGKPLELPVYLEPTKEESKLMTIFDDNHDGMTWGYTNNDNGTGMFMWLGYLNRADDWMFLPMINFPSADGLYNFTFDISSVVTTYTTEDFDIYVASKPDPDYVESLIFSQNEFEVGPSPENVSVKFAVKNAGINYIGFHLRSSNEGNHQGIRVGDFNISRLDGKTSNVPDAVDFASITAAEKGELKATVKAKLPKLNMIGQPLDANTPLTLIFSSDKETVKATGKPGEEVYATASVMTDGFNKFEVSVANANGDGLKRYYRAYVGLDTPLAPGNITICPDDDNLGGTLTWSKPSEVGQHGGYVNPDDITYNIYSVSGIQYTKIASTRDLKFTWRCATPTQMAYRVGPSATNRMGESVDSRFVLEALGDPYEIPIVDELSTTGFGMSPYNFMTVGEFEPSHWENVSGMNGLGIGDGIMTQGGFACYSESGDSGWGELIVPKFTTKGVSKASFRIRFWDYKDCPKVSIYGRRSGHLDLEKIGDIVVNRPAKGTWEEGIVSLPEEYTNQGWVQFRIRVRLTGGASEYFMLDNIQITPDVDRDLKVAGVSGPALATVGQNVKFQATVINSGYERLGGSLVLELIDTHHNKVVDYKSTNVTPIQSGKTFVSNFEFELDGKYTDVKDLAVKATVIADGDEVANNNSRHYTMEVKNSVVPVVSDLKASQDEATGNVALTWSEPALTYGDFLDVERDGEAFKSDISSVSGWKLVDRDGGSPFGIQGLENVWSTDKMFAPASWMIFDAEKAGTLNDARLCPHSGKRFLMARTNQYEEEGDYIQAQDWLISPEVVGGTEVSFWLNHLDTTYTEYVELYYSYTTDDIESFKMIRTFSKSGSEAWEEVKFTLPENVRYFALVYRSFNCYAAMIDDISFTPKNLDVWELDHYSLWRALYGEKEAKCISEKLTATSFSDEKISAEGATYFLTTTVKDAHDGSLREGPRSNYAYVGISSVDDIRMLDGVFGGKGVITAVGHNGDTLAVYGADGKFLRLVALTSDRESIEAEAGIYIVKSGNRAAKVMVK